jgi:hypothetical protein
MGSIRRYVAASVDGYIADTEGDVGWLQPFEAVEYGYERLIDVGKEHARPRPRTFSTSEMLRPD